MMPDLYDLDPLSPAEQRLLADAVFGGLNYPDNNRDAYFKEGFALLRTVNQPQKVRKVITSYLNCAKDPSLRADLQKFLNELGEEK